MSDFSSASGGGSGRGPQPADSGGLINGSSRPYHICRIHADVKVNEGFMKDSVNLPAQLLAIDFRPDQAQFFTMVPIEQGKSIGLTLEIPSRFYVAGQVEWSKRLHNTSKLICPKDAERMLVRIGMKFHIKSEEEQQQIHRFIKEMKEKLIFRMAYAASMSADGLGAGQPPEEMAA